MLGETMIWRETETPMEQWWKRGMMEGGRRKEMGEGEGDPDSILVREGGEAFEGEQGEPKVRQL